MKTGSGTIKKTGRSVFLFSSDWDQGGYPEGCPFNSRRAGLARNMAASMGLLSGSGEFEKEPQPATETEMARFHAPKYLEALRKAGEGDLPPESFAMGIGTQDCPVFKGMYEYAASTVGGTLTGARLILKGAADAVFNPAGGYHHAGPDYASGFCFVNDVVLAAMEFTAAGQRVLFIDLDVHHCDGVQNAFYNRRDVMTLSLHESGKTLFPGTGFETEIGVGDGRGYSVNIPLPVGTYDGIYMEAVHEIVIPLARAYDPDVIIVELGMDALASDPLAHLHLTNNALADSLRLIMELGKPVLATGGGGYNVDNTVRGWALVWSVLCGEQVEEWTVGLGGVMLENSEWAGGLRDRMLLSDAGRRLAIDSEVRQVMASIKASIFPIHKIKA
jgi:acetoin utilization protein AcuC